MCRLQNQPVEPERITTDGLASYGSAMRELELKHLHQPTRLRENNRVENSHLPIRRRERQQQGFKSHALTQKSAPPTPGSTTPSPCGTTWVADRLVAASAPKRCSLGGGGCLTVEGGF
ncbi:DDE-type integrase/transposase/recombinase [Brevundimonas nasdae]|uniref:DDE-type integrase/transposase/recombinase n=1 Tax=Brevundimonas nasdae TaxID=172043 RepID=UPI0009FD1702|nr:DDE-type integrase/transposase/recombinase [Brevundimonas nasdae]